MKQLNNLSTFRSRVLFSCRSSDRSKQLSQLVQSLGTHTTHWMSQRPIQLILDFDGTLTEKDTLHLVAEAGYNINKINGGSKTLPPWQDIVNAYLTDYEVHATTYQPAKSARTTISSEAAWLDSLQDVEAASAERVINTGIFDGLTMQDMELAASDALTKGQVALRPGWAQLILATHYINHSAGSGGPEFESIQIVSVNWSRWFVWNVIWIAASSSLEHKSPEVFKQVFQRIAVYANEVPSIAADTTLQSTRQTSPRGHAMTLRTAGDKLRHISAKTTTQEIQAHPFKIYVGDSATDLECLLMADVGICMRNQNMSSGQQDLESTCERIGVRVKSLSEFQGTHRTPGTFNELESLSKRVPTVLYYVYDFHEVERWLKSLASNPQTLFAV